MRIRKFKKEDGKVCSAIARKNLRTINRKDYSPETIRALLKRNTSKVVLENALKRPTFVAVEQDRIVGMGAYEKNDLHSFFVRPDHHRKGIGSALLHKVLEEAKKEGIKIMYCHSSFFAEPFYASHGFQRIEKKTFPFYSSTLSVIRMKKKL